MNLHRVWQGFTKSCYRSRDCGRFAIEFESAGFRARLERRLCVTVLTLGIMGKRCAPLLEKLIQQHNPGIMSPPVSPALSSPDFLSGRLFLRRISRIQGCFKICGFRNRSGSAGLLQWMRFWKPWGRKRPPDRKPEPSLWISSPRIFRRYASETG